jgi:molybdopterin-guanine dinucleotide biosynthesis protein B
MKAIAFVGNSRTGKTHLISRLIPELKRRGHSVAVVKHCHHGFSLSPEGKDSWKLAESGSVSVCMVGPGELALLRKEPSNPALSTIAGRYFHGVDIVLVEGGRKDRALKKIELLRKDVSEKPETSAEERLAIVTDFELSAADTPVFHPDQIAEIADVVESESVSRLSRVQLDVDGISVPIKGFVQNIFEKTILGLISTLKGVRKDPRHVTVTIDLQEIPDE